MGLPRASSCWCTALRIVFRSVADAASVFSLRISGKLHMPASRLLDLRQQRRRKKEPPKHQVAYALTRLSEPEFRSSEPHCCSKAPWPVGSVAGSPAFTPVTHS